MWLKGKQFFQQLTLTLLAKLFSVILQQVMETGTAGIQREYVDFNFEERIELEVEDKVET